MKSIFLYFLTVVGLSAFGQNYVWQRIPVEKDSSDKVIGLFQSAMNTYPVYIVTKQRGLLQMNANLYPVQLTGFSLDTLNEHLNYPGQDQIVKELDSNLHTLIYKRNTGNQYQLDTAGLPKNPQTNWLQPIKFLLEKDYAKIVKFESGEVFYKSDANTPWVQFTKPELANAEFYFLLNNATIAAYANDSIYFTVDNYSSWQSYGDSLLSGIDQIDSIYEFEAGYTFHICGRDLNNANQIFSYYLNGQGQIEGGEWTDSHFNELSTGGNPRKLWMFNSYVGRNFLIFESDTSDSELTIHSSRSAFDDLENLNLNSGTWFKKPTAFACFIDIGFEFPCVFVKDQGIYQTQMAITLEEKTILKSLELRPNPTHSYFELPDELIVQSIEITDLYGRSTTLNRSDDNHYDISRLTPGYYIVKVLDQAGHYSTGKLIVQ